MSEQIGLHDFLFSREFIFCILRCMGVYSGEATLPYSFLTPFLGMVNSLRKEFAPLGANSLLQELTLLERFIFQRSRQ